MVKWTEKLKQRWKLDTVSQVILVLVVFAFTGFTVLFIKRPLFEYLYPTDEKPVWASILYWVLIFPVYNGFLLFYGLLFGQFRFFWEFEKQFFSRLASKFKKAK